MSLSQAIQADAALYRVRAGVCRARVLCAAPFRLLAEPDDHHLHAREAS